MATCSLELSWEIRDIEAKGFPELVLTETQTFSWEGIKEFGVGDEAETWVCSEAPKTWICNLYSYKRVSDAVKTLTVMRGENGTTDVKPVLLG